MGTYVVTGSASGMGFAAAEKLRAEGHKVIGIDLREGDVVADLSDAEQRQRAAKEALELAGDTLDGAVLAAGVGPIPGPDKAPLILQVNFFGVIELLEALRPAFAKNGNAKVVVVGSNSTTTMPMIPEPAIAALIDRDLDTAVQVVGQFGEASSNMAYGSSKVAVHRWVRDAAVKREWAGEGIRLNVIAPGAILTPLLEKQLSTPEEAKAIESFPVPIGGYGKPEDVAAWIYFMLQDTANFLVGSVVTLDGGSDAWFRAHDWPKAMPQEDLQKFSARMQEFTPYNK